MHTHHDLSSSLQGHAVNRAALGELIKTLVNISEREDDAFRALSKAIEEDDCSTIVLHARELVAIRQHAPTGKPEDCAR